MMVIAPAICGSIIAAHGSPELKQAWLPGLANGTQTMSFAITEPDAGSNTHALTTTSRRDGDDYVISGTKYWIRGADQADAIWWSPETATWTPTPARAGTRRCRCSWCRLARRACR